MISIRLAGAACLIAVLASPIALARPPEGASLNTDILLIQFHDQPLNKYAGGVPGLRATARAATGQRLVPASPDSRAYLDWLHRQQDGHLDAISDSLGRQLDVVFRYDVLMNGIAIRAQAGDFSRIKALRQVKAVAFDVNYPLHTDRGPQWIGAPGIWDGSGTDMLGDTRGEGIVIGVIDTGVNFGHPSYSETPDDGHIYVNPNGPNTFLGWCDPGHPDHDPAYMCNNKLIGAWDYADAASGGIESDGPVDNDGHGSHTSSTAGGNTLTSPAISGVAPHANIIMYDACYIPAPGELGSCPFSATSAAAQQAVSDGVDVLNYSISGGGSPWSPFDIDSFFLDLTDNGTFVAASAGNSGAAGTVGHNGPWVATSGASTHDREDVRNMLVNMTGGVSPPAANITGRSRTTGYGPAPIVYAMNFVNDTDDPEQCLEPFPGGTWTNEIVLCDRGGEIARVQKCANVAAGGAAGCILADSPSGGGGPVADAHVIPGIHVGLADGNALRSWLASGSDHMGEITDGTIIVNPALADIMAGFSSRGPGPIDVIKPDLTNPGVQIFAAVQAGSIEGFPGPDFGTISGTSMSSPHTAGSGALMMGLHPGWTPAEIKSALMSTAVTSVLKENGSTPSDPFDRGGGRVDLSAAAQAGLVLNESTANFRAADPDAGGDPRTLNLATMMSSTCAVTCFFNRTVKNVRSFTTHWTFSDTGGPDVSMAANPSSFSLAAGATQVIEFAVTITGGEPGFVFGEGTFNEDGGMASPAHFSAAVREADLDTFPIFIESLERTGEHLHEDVITTGASDLQLTFAGMVPLQRSRDEVAQDPTNGSAFDNDAGTVTYWLNGLSGHRRIHASTMESDAPDLDLFVGRDVNTDGIPQGSEIRCSSTSSSAIEACEILDPENGNWWIRVQNWLGSGAPLDAFTILYGAVGPGDEGNFMAVPTDSSPGPGERFDVSVIWDFGAAGGDGRHIGVLDFGSSPATPGDLGTITVDFVNDRITASGFE